LHRWSRQPGINTPTCLNPDVGLIHPPTVVGRFESRAQTSLQFQGVALDPSPDRDVIGALASLGEQLFDVAVRKGKAQVPPHCQENHLRLKLPPLEKTANRRGQEEHPASLPCGDCKVATLPCHGPPGSGAERKPPRSSSRARCRRVCAWSNSLGPVNGFGRERRVAKIDLLSVPKSFFSIYLTILHGGKETVQHSILQCVGTRSQTKLAMQRISLEVATRSAILLDPRRGSFVCRTGYSP
jgi:hypothetical protein